MPHHESPPPRTTAPPSEAAELPIRRSIARVVVTPPPLPGFAGPGHEAVEVLRPDALAASDPFVLLMDDRLDFADGQAIGGAHPHAGLETVTVLLEGSIRDRDEGTLDAGDAIWMTAGRGIIHNEHVEAAGKARVLQLWITLPQAQRDAEPSFEVIRLASLPVRRGPGVQARLYSGRSGGLRSPTRNRVPVTLLDIELEPGAVFEQELPATYNGFVYVLAGAVDAGVGTRLGATEVGWLDRIAGDGPTTLRLVAEASGARLVLYAGERQETPIVQHGPFVAGAESDIPRLFRDYRAGRFVRLSELARTTHSPLQFDPRQG